MPQVVPALAEEIFKSYSNTVRWYDDAAIREGSLDAALEWCRKNVRGFWVWDMQAIPSLYEPGVYRFYFEREDDFTMFLLTWT